jgi:hypothetical protein
MALFKWMANDADEEQVENNYKKGTQPAQKYSSKFGVS